MSGYEGNRERFTGFAAEYDRYRFRPPAVLAEILCRYANVERPALVVDLGCATGPSTRLWAERAARVIGIDPVEGMLETARAATRAANVEYRLGYGHETGLSDACADVITCSQSFHWMEPGSTLAEAARVLRPGGVFAAYHYRTVAVTGIAALDRAAQGASDRIYALEVKHGLKEATRFYGKAEHTKRLRASGHFAFVKEFGLHNVEETTAERLVGGFETLGALQSLRKMGISEEETGIAALRDAAETWIGSGSIPEYVSYRVSLGVTPPPTAA